MKYFSNPEKRVARLTEIETTGMFLYKSRVIDLSESWYFSDLINKEIPERSPLLLINTIAINKRTHTFHAQAHKSENQHE